MWFYTAEGCRFADFIKCLIEIRSLFLRKGHVSLSSLKSRYVYNSSLAYHTLHRVLKKVAPWVEVKVSLFLQEPESILGPITNPEIEFSRFMEKNSTKIDPEPLL